MKGTVLIIDDEEDFLALCHKTIVSDGYECDACSTAEEAYRLFHQRMYDIFICDVLIPFQGNREGGLLISQEFSKKYPASCIILISQYVTAKWVNVFAGKANFAFVEKTKDFLDDLKREIMRANLTKYCFVCMPLNPSFNDIYELGIKTVVQESGFRCLRADEIHHNMGILRVVYDQIISAHIIIADMTGQNPNVYYEVGFAHGIGKEVVLLTQKMDDIPFDLRGFNHIMYEGKIMVLKDKLQKRIAAMFSQL